MIRTVFDTLGAPVLAVLFILLLIVETRWQLRKRVQRRWKRMIINFIVSIPAFVLLRILLIPVMVWLAIKSQVLHMGLNYLDVGPPFLKAFVAFILLDYSNYLWHILLHKLPFLWRFHLVHHTDLDLDLTTAFRFHFGELVASAFFRGTAVFLIGVSPIVVIFYEIIFEAATQFHHSNTRLPYHFERLLNKIIVTPRMHGIHHSMIKKETDSNFSVIFSIWDKIHKTLKLNVRQNSIVTGVPAYADEKELTIGNLLKLPFTKIRKWEEAKEKKNKII